MTCSVTQPLCLALTIANAQCMPHCIQTARPNPEPRCSCLQEDSFHLVDNRPAKATKFGQRRFQQNKFAQQRREREAARAEREKREGGGGRQQQQKKNPWQQHWREQQRVRTAQQAGTRAGPGLAGQSVFSWSVCPHCSEQHVH